MIYVHVPFCGSFCTYCDFYSEAACNQEAYEKYLNCLISEIDSRRPEIEATLKKNTLYIGGGTPSVLPLSYIEQIVAHLPYGPFEEFTIEVNPEDIVRKGAEYVRSLKDLGVNRVSMGVQSMDDGILRWMRRRHDSKRASEAFRTLREGGMDNISIDLICGISQMTDSNFENSLRSVLEWQPEHISIYQLSIEPGSELARMVEEGRYEEADDAHFRNQYLAACRILRECGYEHYEISNWALPGRRAIHNSAYWTRTPYVGLGPAAHSLSRSGSKETRSWNSEELRGWTSGAETLGAEEIREERIMLGLRTAEGWGGIRLSEEEWLVSDAATADVAAAEPELMGILNLTPDSYFASSRCASDQVAERILDLAEKGADIIDLGAVSTRPGAEPVDAETEWKRLEPALSALTSLPARNFRISIDTFRSEIVERAYRILGPKFIVNDISAGEDDSRMLETVGKLGMEYIAMHKRGTPQTMDSSCDYPDGVISELKRYFTDFESRAEAAGIKNWILDPGLGFAKTDEQNWEILENLKELKTFGRAILISSSDKRFTKLYPDGNSRAHKLALKGGASILRLHL